MLITVNHANIFTSNSRKQLHYLPLRLTVISLLFMGLCFMRKPISIKTGEKFNRLTVISKEPSLKGHAMYRCLCDCGNYIVTRGSALLSDNTKGCGCLNVESYTNTFGNYRKAIANGATLNGRHTSEYGAYSKMKERCYNPKVDRYPCYGERGIIVCQRWLDRFSNFLEDMGRKPTPQHSLDRFPDVNGNYEPSNCRWGTEEQQAANRQNTIRLTLKGAEIHQAALARLLNVTPHSIEYHIRRGKNGDEIYSYFKSKGNVDRV